MSETKRTNQKLVPLAECAIMLALSIVLSFVAIWQMPMGGEVTLLSMLPICLIGVKYGPKTGLAVAFAFSIFQLVQSIIKGNVFVYTTTIFAVIVCVIFDYLLPFSALGLAGIFKKYGKVGIVAGIALVIVFRFVCHYITGVVIWGQWAEDMSKYLYSLIYNGQYMLPECIITSVAAAIIVNVPQVQKLLDIKKKTN